MGDSCLAGNLLELLAQIPDPRGRHGRRHSLAAMLTAIVCAILTGARGCARHSRMASPTNRRSFLANSGQCSPGDL